MELISVCVCTYESILFIKSLSSKSWALENLIILEEIEVATAAVKTSLNIVMMLSVWSIA